MNETTYVPSSWTSPRSISPGRADEAAWFIGRLYQLHHFRDDPGLAAGFPLWWKINRRMMGNDYAKTIQTLVDAGAAYIVHEYSAGKGNRPGSSRQYRLHERHLDSGHRRHRFQSPEFLKRLTPSDDHRLADVHIYLRNQLYRLSVAQGAPRDKSLSLAMIADKHPFFSVCAMGRVHTPLTNMGREYRQYVRFGEERLWQVDVRASQPLINGVAAMLGGTPAAVAEYARRLDPDGRVNRTGYTKDIVHANFRSPNGTMVVDDGCVHRGSWLKACGASNVPSNVLDWCRRCVEPAVDLYEQFRVWDERYGSRIGRDDAKGFLLPALYDHSHRICGTDDMDPTEREVRKLLGVLYPNIVRYLRYRNSTNSKHGEAARYAQTLESYAVIRTACEQFRLGDPGAFLATVHDSLVVCERSLDLAEQVLREAFVTTFGVSPMLKRSVFG